ncbi:hypothetical protein [Lysinibacillus xylanilyticus]|uniref:Uncharacterized protein n=1 Tax=Lysinibacillus xylanilyticus TaxID=582475 RepID=A0A2M9Q5P8_9BACI|nr:hypothetical protein [Lysinibacillus xylanilyticus]PJO43384.1 hypothetical protein CWD94_12590 [Lysinibacillus xylanilyticus]
MDKKSVVKTEDLYPVGELQITKGISFLNVPKNEYSTLLKKYPVPGFYDLKLPKGIIDVEVDSHAFERWNQRVGPITTDEILTNIFRVAILINPNRVRVLDRGLAILDKEVVFSFEFEDSILKVTTFFGRISLKPLLLNVDTLRKYNQHYSEEVDLSIDSEVINQQGLPIVPSSVIEFVDSNNIPHLLFYIQNIDTDNNSKRNFFYHLIKNIDMVDGENGNDLVIESIEKSTDDVIGEWIFKEIDMSHPTRYNLSDIQLHVLGLLGNNQFLLKYMAKKDPERLEKLHETHSRSAIRRYAGNKNWNILQKKKK